MTIALISWYKPHCSKLGCLPSSKHNFSFDGRERSQEHWSSDPPEGFGNRALLLTDRNPASLVIEGIRWRASRCKYCLDKYWAETLSFKTKLYCLFWKHKLQTQNTMYLNENPNHTNLTQIKIQQLLHTYTKWFA